MKPLGLSTSGAGTAQCLDCTNSRIDSSVVSSLPLIFASAGGRPAGRRPAGARDRGGMTRFVQYQFPQRLPNLADHLPPDRRSSTSGVSSDDAFVPRHQKIPKFSRSPSRRGKERGLDSYGSRLDLSADLSHDVFTVLLLHPVSTFPNGTIVVRVLHMSRSTYYE